MTAVDSVGECLLGLKDTKQTPPARHPTMRILGIDPGSVSGAWALLDVTNVGTHISAECGDLDVVDRMVDAASFAKLVRHLAPDFAIVENVSAMPKQGATSGFRFGMGVGIIHGVLLACHVRTHLVRASEWKKHFRLSADKELSRALAIRMFPERSNELRRVKDHGRAEALLIAEFGHIKFAKQPTI